MFCLKRLSAAILISCLSAACTAKTEKVEVIYKKNCASCHGNKLQGGLGGPLVGKHWKNGDTDADLTRVIKTGIAKKACLHGRKR